MIHIEVDYIPSEWVLNEDNEWACGHNDYSVEEGEEFYHDPSNYYGVGSRTYDYAVCEQCDATGTMYHEQDEDGISTYIEWETGVYN